MIGGVIAGAVRTPIGRHGGALSGVRPDDLAAHVLAELASRTGLATEDVDQVFMGCTNQAGEDNHDAAYGGPAGPPPGAPRNDRQPAVLGSQSALAVLTGDAAAAVGRESNP